MRDKHGSSGCGWRGVDLDGTLAVYTGWVAPDHIGVPIPEMVRRVRGWLAKGEVVKIVTARVHPGKSDAPICRMAIDKWVEEVFGEKLEVTHEKDHLMIELWDDRVVQVIPNTGIRIDEFNRKLLRFNLWSFIWRAVLAMLVGLGFSIIVGLEQMADLKVLLANRCLEMVQAEELFRRDFGIMASYALSHYGKPYPVLKKHGRPHKKAIKS